MNIQPTTTETAQEVQAILQTFESKFSLLMLPYETKIYLVKRQLIVAELDRNNWNICKTAAALRMHRNTLTRTMDQVRITKAERAVLPISIVGARLSARLERKPLAVYWMEKNGMNIQEWSKRHSREQALKLQTAEKKGYRNHV